MVKRILALSLLMVGLAGCGSGGGAESELATENTAQIMVEGATAGCRRVCETNANGTTYSAFGNDISICYAYKRCDNYTECMSGCAE